MGKPTGPTNQGIQELIKDLKKVSAENKVGIWKRVAEDLEKPTRERREVNTYKIERYANDGETIVVPGKVLGSGEVKKKVKVAAMSFSQSAKKKVVTMSIRDLMKENPKGKNVRILG